MFYINQVFSFVLKNCFELEFNQLLILLNYLSDFIVLVHFDGHKFLFLKKKVFPKIPKRNHLPLKKWFVLKILRKKQLISS